VTFGSLFAGIGGVDLGFYRAGLRCAWQVEIGPDARRVLRHHWPDATLHEDVRTVDKRCLPRVDIICGGFPCQDLSVAGKRAGLGGERSGLFYEMTRVVRELQPSLLVWENVPGLLSSGAGRCFLAVLTELDRIGYSGGWRTLDAQHFGVPQRRRRVFGVFLEGRAGAGRAAEILALSEGGRRDSQAGGEAGADVAFCLAASVRGTGDGHGQGWNSNYIASRQSGPGVNPPGRGGEDDQNLVYQCHGSNVGPMGTVRAGNGGLTGGVPFIVNAAESCATERHARPSDVARCLDQTGGFAANQGGTVVVFAQNQRDEVRDLNGLAGALAAEPGMKQQTFIGFSHTQGIDRQPSESAKPTLRADGGGQAVATPMMVRRLTPVECCRLQGFPDSWLDLDPPLADSAKYRLLGNAVCVNVAEWIGRRIMEARP
jgi:DNA (cytosine-5)-methyltransferase 1